MRLEVLTLIDWKYVILHMDTERGQVGDLIELAVIALARMTIELQLGYPAIRTGASHIADIAEATAHVDISSGIAAIGWLLTDKVKRHGIHEVGAIGTLEDAEQHIVGTLTARNWGIANTCNDMRLP